MSIEAKKLKKSLSAVLESSLKKKDVVYFITRMVLLFQPNQTVHPNVPPPCYRSHLTFDLCEENMMQMSEWCQQNSTKHMLEMIIILSPLG